MKTPHMSTGKGDRVRTWDDSGDAVPVAGDAVPACDVAADWPVTEIWGALIVAMT